MEEKLKRYDFISEDSIASIKEELATKEDLVFVTQYLERLILQMGSKSAASASPAPYSQPQHPAQPTQQPTPTQTSPIQSPQSTTTSYTSTNVDIEDVEPLPMDSGNKRPKVVSDKEKGEDLLSTLKVGIKSLGKSLKDLRDDVKKGFAKVSDFNKKFFPDEPMDTAQTFRLYALLAAIKLIDTSAAFLIKSVADLFKNPPKWLQPVINSIEFLWGKISDAFNSLSEFIFRSPFFAKLAEKLGLDVDPYEEGSLGSKLKTATGEDVKTHFDLSSTTLAGTESIGKKVATALALAGGPIGKVAALALRFGSFRALKNQVRNGFLSLDPESKKLIIQALDLDKDFGLSPDTALIPDNNLIIARVLTATGQQEAAEALVDRFASRESTKQQNREKANLSKYKDIFKEEATEAVSSEQLVASGYTPETYPFEKYMKSEEDGLQHFTPEFIEFQQKYIESKEPKIPITPLQVAAAKPTTKSDEEVIPGMTPWNVAPPTLEETPGYQDYLTMKSTPVQSETNAFQQVTVNNNYSLVQPETSNMGR